MKVEEMRELDHWISDWIFETNGLPSQDPSYTTDPAASDALDDKILEKLSMSGRILSCFKANGVFYFAALNDEGEPLFEVHHPDKKICRALFTKKLFTK